MQVKDIMSTHVVDVQPETPIWQAIQLMQAQKVSGLPVVDRGGRLLGILSEGDLLRRVELGTIGRSRPWFAALLQPGGSAEAYTTAYARTVGDVMSHPPVTIAPEATLEHAVSLMERHKVKRLPVLDGGRLIGILSRADFLRALVPVLAPAYEEPATSDGEIAATIRSEMGAQGWAEDAIVSVRVIGGHVVLLGSVGTEAQRTALRVLAENVNGVRSVSVDDVVSDQMLSAAF
jgi:CBS domain-containing protein